MEEELLDASLPWDDFLKSDDDFFSEMEDDRPITSLDARITTTGPSIALRAAILHSGAAPQLLVRHPAWVYLTSDGAIGQHAYELKTQGTWITTYEHDDAEAEFWRFVHWRFRWEPPVMLAIIGLSFALRFVSPLPTSLQITYVVASLTFIVSAVVLSVLLWRVPADAGRKSERSFASIAFSLLPVFGVTGALAAAIASHALQGSNCSTTGRFTTVRSICLRQLTSDYSAFQFVCALMIQRLSWSSAILVVTQIGAIITFALSPEYTAIDVGFFGGLGLCVIALHIALASLLKAQQRRQFQLAVRLMLSARDLQKQALALANVARATLPVRVGNRLNQEATAPLRESQTDVATQAFVVAVEARRFSGWHCGDVQGMIRSAHNIFSLLDVLARTYQLDHAGAAGDSYLVTSGLHGDARDDRAVSDFITSVARLPLLPARTTRGPQRRSALAVAACIGSARSEFVGSVGVRYCVTGSAVSAVILRSRRTPDAYLWMSDSAMATLSSTHALYGTGESCDDGFLVPFAPIAGRRNSELFAAPRSNLEPWNGTRSSSTPDSSHRPGSAPSREALAHNSALVQRLTNDSERQRRLSRHQHFTSALPPTTATLTSSPPPPSAQVVESLELSGSQLLDLQAAKEPIEQVTWYGTFVNDETETAYHSFAMEEVQRVAVPVVYLISAFFGVMAIAIGLEQALDADLHGRTKSWQLAACLVTLIAFAILLAVTGALMLKAQSLRAGVEWWLVLAVSLGGWIPVVLMPENICSNRPHFIILVTTPATCMLLQRLPWTVASAYVLVIVDVPIIVLSQYIAIQSVGNVVSAFVLAIFVCVWCARLTSLQGRYRYADSWAMSKTSKRMLAFANVLRGAIFSTFPRHCVRSALEALTDTSPISESEGTRAERHWGSLSLALVSFLDTHDDTGRAARVIGEAIESLPAEVALIQSAGHELTIASGFDSADKGCAPLLKFLHQLRDVAKAAGCPFVAGLAVEEAQGALIGRRDALRFHLVGASTTLVRALIDAYTPALSVPSADCALLCTTSFTSWLEWSLQRPLSAAAPTTNPLADVVEKDEVFDSPSIRQLAAPRPRIDGLLASLGYQDAHYIKIRHLSLGRTVVALLRSSQSE